MLTSRVFRLFVSSTFSDFVAEREALQQRVFPKLQKFCAERGASFQAVDLRWGITEQAQQEHNTMRICLEEVRRCQQLSPRPNFAVLLGDRYGWEPLPARIPRDHWRLLKLAATAEHWKRIEASYRLDNNAIPPMYYLRERHQHDAVAFENESMLLQALRHAARGFRGKARLPYFASATHQEIALGALSRYDGQGGSLDPKQHVHVYVRHLAGLPQDVRAQDFIDWDRSRDQAVPGARQRLRGLEAQLRRQLGGHVHDLHTHWSLHGHNGTTDNAYLERFCEAFFEHQVELIEAELASLDQIDERRQREHLHHAFGAERARVFAGRGDLLARIANYTSPRQKGHARNSRPTGPLILLGSGGSGKSALLARAAQQDLKALKRALVLQRFVGGVPGTESLMTLLGSLIADIAILYAQPEPPPLETASAMAEAFRDILRHASAQRPLVIYLDALDQLDKSDSAWRLEWLPRDLPAHVSIVASARVGTPVELSARRRYAEGCIDVPSMKLTEGRAMLNAWLADKRAAWFNAGIAPSKGRRLTTQQKATVLDAFRNNGSALWLKLAYEDAATWSSWDEPRQLPTTVHGLIDDLIDQRLLKKENHPKVFTERAIAYLAAGRFGLSEVELDRALGTDPAVRAEFQANERTQKRWTDGQSLPPILWSRLYFDLQPYLGLASVDGAPLMRWFHREFGEVLKARYLAGAQDRQAIHGRLAQTFWHLERELRSHDTHDDKLFRATDAGGQQVSAALRRVMEQPWQLAQAGQHEALQALLTDFGFCIGKCAANRGADLVEDYRTSNIAGGSDSPQGGWLSIVREKGHLLRRGTLQWPGHKILLQVAVDDAHDSPLTQAAQAWLAGGACDWVWLRRRNRPSEYTPRHVLAVMEGHTGSVTGATVLGDGRVLSWSDDGTLRLWDGTSGTELAVMEGEAGPIWGASALADGRVLSIAGVWETEGRSGLWESTTGAALPMEHGLDRPIRGAVPLPDGRIVFWFDDGTLYMSGTPRGMTQNRMKGHTRPINGVMILPDGNLLSWSMDGSLRLWDSKTGATLAILAGHTQPVKGVRLMANGRVLSLSEDGTLRIWNGASGQTLAVLVGHTGAIWGARIMSDDHVLSWSEDGTLRLWDVGSGATLNVIEGPSGWISDATVLPDGHVLTWSRDIYVDYTLRLWDVQTGTELAVMEGHTSWINGATPLPDGRILSWSGDGTLRLWDAETGATLGILEGHTEMVNGAKVLPDGRLLSWSGDTTLRLWDGKSGKVPQVTQGHHAKIGATVLTAGQVLSWSNDFLASDFALRLWDIHTGSVLAVMNGHTWVVLGALVLSDGRVLSWSGDATLRLWNKQTGAELAVMEGHTESVKGALMLSNGQILSWSMDETLRLWDGQSGQALGVMEGPGGPVESAVALTEGRVLSWSSSWNSDNTLHLWNVQTQRTLALMAGHTANVVGIQILKGDHVLSWSRDATLRLWDGDTGALKAVMQGHTESVDGATVLPDGRVLSWSSDQTLRLWDGQTGAALGIFHKPWLQTIPYPAPWESIEHVERDHQMGKLWTHTTRSTLHVINRREGWSAQWHGISLEYGCTTPSCCVVHSGRDLIILEVMLGQEPLNVTL